MKIVNKWFIMMTLLIVVSTVFVSCSNDEDNVQLNITGTWECVSGSRIEYNLDTGEQKSFDDSEMHKVRCKYYIYDDGSFYQIYRETKQDGVYKQDGNKIDFIYSSKIETYYIDEISSSKMILSRENKGILIIPDPSGKDTRQTLKIIRKDVFEKK